MCLNMRILFLVVINCSVETVLKLEIINGELHCHQ